MPNQSTGVEELIDQLGGGDRRSIGRVPEVVNQVLRTPSLVGKLLRAMTHADAVVRMRAADALEKITRDRPELLARHKRRVLTLARTAEQQEVRWHLAQLLPRLPLNAAERADVLQVMSRYLRDPSSIVRTFAMQALADIGLADPDFRPRILRQIRRVMRTGTPAMRARGRKILQRAERQ